MSQPLKGVPVAKAMNAVTADLVKHLLSCGVTPTLAIVRMGAREDDLSYERGAMKRCEAVGVTVKPFTLPEDAPQDELIQVIDRINADATIHGALIFRPLPRHIDDEAVRARLNPEKDVDGITNGSLARVFTGAGAGFPPCTAQAVMELLDFYGIDPRGKRTVVIGRSLVVGKPVAMLLLARHATVTICHTRTVDMPAICREAELLIVAAGRAGIVDASYTAPGQTVVDVGIHVTADGKLTGDVAYDAVEPLVSAITPVPGGVGAVTTAVLVRNVVDAARRQTGQDDT